MSWSEGRNNEDDSGEWPLELANPNTEMQGGTEESWTVVNGGLDNVSAE